MGVQVQPPKVPSKFMALRRLSTKMDSLFAKAGTKKRPLDAPKRIPSDISDLDRTRGPALSEVNALSDEGVKIIDQIAIALEERISCAKSENENDPFSRHTVPGFSLFDYLARMARYVNVWRGHAGGSESAGVRSAVMVVMYLERLDVLRPEYLVNRYNIHRLAMAAFLVATKFTEDQPISNDFWARVGGVEMKEVNQLEREFCQLLQYELFIDENEYIRYLDQFDLPEF